MKRDDMVKIRAAVAMAPWFLLLGLREVWRMLAARLRGAPTCPTCWAPLDDSGACPYGFGTLGERTGNLRPSLIAMPDDIEPDPGRTA